MHETVHQDSFHIVLKGVVIESEENHECINGYHSFI
ncbi:hypothetical protein BWGOE8_45880 [Bacillus mycoides]|uniref:Uncharacterized protein n=2 Tax=Bacillus cereus group TaxID=86661 RepID=J8E879_BACCE|nr:hypothetical protein IGC_00955 [Bacillus cereus HuA4-10]OFD72230.1 hypothetical protein BWGOE9_46910 [Bacillus mycoides]OFD72800.1 hypothetical protein BWGOE8_45880 [Bacillus mycoides]OFD75698.1 hypothetical protein BWGOE10_46320 [Bacillus mycoides]